MIGVFGAKLGKEELSQVKECLDKSWMGMGEKVVSFEKKMAARLGVRDMVMVDSCSNALMLAVKLLNLPIGSGIILPSFTWVSCAHAIILNGHYPIFSDVDISSYNITAKHCEKLARKAKAIMVVHYAGKPVNVDEVKQFGLPVIEDAAHAVDSKLNGISCGTMGKIGTYSFNSIKNISTPEGGGIVGDEGLLREAREHRYCGITKSGYSSAGNGRWWEHDVKNIWIKMLPNDVSAGIGLAQLGKLDSMQKRRKKIWDTYQKELPGWVVKPLDPLDNERHSYFTYLIRVKNRNKLATHLLNNGVYTTLRFHPLHMNGAFGVNEKLPNCESLNKDGLNLPLHPNMTDGDVDKVIELMKKWKK